MKSSSVSRKHRLSKTLKRWVEFRPIENEDIRYLWPAYLEGQLPMFKEGLTAKDFKEAVEVFILENYHGGWTLLANTQKGYIPVGMVFAKDDGVFSEPVGKIAAVIWMPWASNRNKYESAVNFFNEIRKEFVFIGRAEMKDKHFYEHIARHGIIRRVGTIHLENELISEWQTIRPKQ
jgi:hypothetical protein